MAKEKKLPIEILLLKSIHLKGEGHQEKFSVIKVDHAFGTRLITMKRGVEATSENIKKYQVDKKKTATTEDKK